MTRIKTMLVGSGIGGNHRVSRCAEEEISIVHRLLLALALLAGLSAISPKSASGSGLDQFQVPSIPIFSKITESHGQGSILGLVRAQCEDGGNLISFDVDPFDADPVDLEIMDSGSNFRILRIKREVQADFCVNPNNSNVTLLKLRCEAPKTLSKGFFIVECLENHETHIPTVRVEDDDGPQVEEPIPSFAVTIGFPATDEGPDFDVALGVRFTLFRRLKRPDLAWEIEGNWRAVETNSRDGHGLGESADLFRLGSNVVYRQGLSDTWNLQWIGGGSWSFASDPVESDGFEGLQSGFGDGYASLHGGFGLELVRKCWTVDFRGLAHFPLEDRLDDSETFELQVGLGFRF